MSANLENSAVATGLEKVTVNKASGGGRIPTELFKILKDDTVIGLHSICQPI